MKLNIKYTDDPEKLKSWNFDEPAIEFYNSGQHMAVPLSKISGLQIKRMLKEWPITVTELLDQIKGGKVEDLDPELQSILAPPTRKYTEKRS